jgi:hypothetical protein
MDGKTIGGRQLAVEKKIVGPDYWKAKNPNYKPIASSEDSLGTMNGIC